MVCFNTRLEQISSKCWSIHPPEFIPPSRPDKLSGLWGVLGCEIRRANLILDCAVLRLLEITLLMQLHPLRMPTSHRVHKKHANKCLSEAIPEFRIACEHQTQGCIGCSLSRAMNRHSNGSYALAWISCKEHSQQQIFFPVCFVLCIANKRSHSTHLELVNKFCTLSISFNRNFYRYILTSSRTYVSSFWEWLRPNCCPHR